MSQRVPQEFLEDALAAWERLRRWTDLNNYLCALRRSPLHRQLQSEQGPYSLRLARRVTEVVDSLTAHEDMPIENDITPRGALLALAKDVRLALSPLPESHPPESGLISVAATQLPFSTCAPVTVVADATHTLDAVASVGSDPCGDWSVAVTHRSVSGTRIMEGLHVLTCPGVQLRLEIAVARLRERLKEEVVGGINWEAFPHTPKELQALRATTMLLDDFEAFYRCLLATFPCARVMGSSHVPVALLPVLYELYYQVGEWVLETEFTARAKPGARVQSFERKKLQFMLLRPDKDSPWGLQFNHNGKLTGVSAVVRAASTAGEKLHQCMRTSKGGLSLLSCNSKQVNFNEMDGIQATAKVDALTPKQKRLFAKVQLVSDSTPSVELLAFHATGAEHPSLPQQQQQQQQQERGPEELPVATLVLHRDNYNVSWDVAITRDLLVVSIPGCIFSPAALAFFARYPRRVRIAAINGVEVTSAAQVEALSSTINTIVLDLQTIPAPSLSALGEVQQEEVTLPAASRVNSSTRQKPQGGGPPTSEDDAVLKHARKQPLTASKEAVAPPTKSISSTKEGDGQRGRKPAMQEQKVKSPPKKANPSCPPEKVVSKAILALPAQDRAPPVPSHPSRSEALETAGDYKGAVQKPVLEAVLRDVDRSALSEKPLVPIHSRELKTKTAAPAPHVTKEEEVVVDAAASPTGCRHKGGPALNNTPVAAVLSEGFTPSLDADGPGELTPAAEVDAARQPPQPPSSLYEEEQWRQLPAELPGSAAATVGPLELPNNVTLNLLTPDEMVLSRQSAAMKWGLSMETVGTESNRRVRVVGLPHIMDQRCRQHPFHRLFTSRAGDWVIMSVNGTPATRLPEIMDIMKHALHMQIKFHRRW
ncbi:hypothetical protein TraAM80_06226 [Trypanosoma rangeli]|uniref:PDZ domain-containing protein n=1 Tax=Trypanosoma rangeli TaxID=5698 RepID=A0A3R7KAN9_TRYRA|nr:uncharacterized protein TraAM80_06226 [Trypanosoma rangeli]RNF02775.1 hypothetical protein TraAM80_06226 [Trypanosoma rangeli]|eukprot:RNF02775.1 hypothetical protein TraAM80_06226 [Trypanosoma rangeli]